MTINNILSTNSKFTFAYGILHSCKKEKSVANFESVVITINNILRNSILIISLFFYSNDSKIIFHRTGMKVIAMVKSENNETK